MCERITLPRSTLLKLRCKLCKGYLSVAPISGNDGRYTCGRCDPTGYGNELYEEIAKSVLFPCSHKNCSETLIWEDVRTHEEQCGFKPIRCPLYLCPSEIERINVNAHFNSHHPDSSIHSSIYQSPSIRLKDVISVQHCLYMYQDKLDCLVFVTINNEMQGHNLRYNLAFGVFALNNLNEKNELKYDVTVTLSSTTQERILSSIGDKIVVFQDNCHCFYCLQNDCLNKNHKCDDAFLTNKFLGLDSKNNNHVTYKIKIYVADCPTPDYKLGLAAKLECPICNKYMVAPIYNCPMGHSLCKDCRNQLEVCAFCQSKLEKSRNYTLEEIAETMVVPCQNVSVGCTYTGIVPDVLKHERSCNF